MRYDVRNKTTDTLIEKAGQLHLLGVVDGSHLLAHAVVRHELIRRGVRCICPAPVAGDLYVAAGQVTKMEATTETPSDGARVVVINGQELRVRPDETVRLSDDGGLAVVPLADAQVAEKKRHVKEYAWEWPGQRATTGGYASGSSHTHTFTVNGESPFYTVKMDAGSVEPPLAVQVEKAIESGNPHGTGAMVCVKVAPDAAKQIAVDDGEPADSLHITLAYLGDADDYTPAMREWVITRVTDAVADIECLSGVTAGLGTFTGKDGKRPLWAAVDIPGLEQVASTVRAELPITDAPIHDHGWTPHLTLGYLNDGDDIPHLDVSGIPLDVRSVHVVFGDVETEIPLQRVTKAAFSTVSKADDAKQYTFSAWYIPDQVDAHGEWSDPDELQQAAWRYVRHNDRRIRLQHDRDVVAGEWLEIVSWPFEITVPRFNPDSLAFEDVTYPAGTVFLGVQWLDWAWELVRAGKIRGLSIGGTAMRVDIDPADAPDEDAA